MVPMKGYTWKNLSENQLKDIHGYMSNKGGKEKDVSGYEIWRIKLGPSLFSAYSKGTLYVNKITQEMKESVDGLLGVSKEETSKKFLIGLDEAGKGEILGNLIIAAVLIPIELQDEIDFELGASDTKRKKTEKYWDDLYIALDDYDKRGMKYEYEVIQPYQIDRYNINKLMDQYYQLIISRLLFGINPVDCRVILDDYGYGKILEDYFTHLKKAGTEIIARSKADEIFAEVKLASTIAKYYRVKGMHEIRENSTFMIEGEKIGSGNAGDKQTSQWIQKWSESGQGWPWFVRQSYKPIAKEVLKENPPINSNLLSDISKDEFAKGRLSVESLSLQCSSCGKSIRSAKITPNASKVNLVGRCINCSEELPGIMNTLRHYSGHILLDSSIIISKIISNDLDGSNFFEGITFILTSEVIEECDKKRSSKQEMADIGRFGSSGRIKLIKFDTQKLELSKDATKDAKIIETAKRIDAIIFTQDKHMYGTAIAEGIFSLIW